MKHIHTALLLAALFAPRIFFAPDTGGASASASGEPETAQDIAKQNADLAARYQELGLPELNYPATPKGLEDSRKEMRRRIAEAEGKLEEEEKAQARRDKIAELTEENDLQALLDLAHEENVNLDSVNQEDASLVAGAIVDKRAADESGE